MICEVNDCHITFRLPVCLHCVLPIALFANKDWNEIVILFFLYEIFNSSLGDIMLRIHVCVLHRFNHVLYRPASTVSRHSGAVELQCL